MAKYTQEFKLKVVKAYLNNEGGYGILAKRFGVKSTSNIQKWISQYNYFGVEGLKRRTKKKEYSTQFKLDVIQYRIDTGDSTFEVSKRFGLSEPSMIIRWERTLTHGGLSELSRKQGRPSMKKQNKNSKKEQEQSAELKLKLLEEKIEKLELENMYLKKLSAYLESPEDISDRHKSKSSKK